MNKQLLLVAKAVSAEKDVPEETVIHAIEIALATATKKRYPNVQMDVEVTIDRKTGAYSTQRCWVVVPDPTDEELIEAPDTQLALTDAKKRKADAKIGDILTEELESVDFGRITAQTAKQVIVQEIRRAEREQVADSYRHKVGQIISGVVKRSHREGLILDLGNNAEAMLRREDMIPRENMRVGDRIRAYLAEVRSALRGPQMIATRTNNEMLIELFKIEVPEIGDEVIQIMGAAREPGIRAKIAVRTNDGRIDPIGACIGMRGARVQAVSNELNGERVDIVLWDENPAQFVINALSLSEVRSIVLDEESRTMDIGIAEEQLSQAIGRNGQNIRLVSELTGWKLNIMSAEDATSKTETESRKTIEMFMNKLGVDQDVAMVLVEEGFSTIEEVAYITVDEFLEVEEFDEEIVEELQRRANNALLASALVSGEPTGKSEPAEDLLKLEGMTSDLAHKLAKQKIITQEDLAECAVGDLMEIEDLGLSEKAAADLIMLARAPWFK